MSESISLRCHVHTSRLDALLPPLLAVAYVAVGPFVLPSSEWLRELGVAMLFLVATVAITGLVGRAAMNMYELIAVTFGTAATLVLPALSARRGHISLWYAGIGAQLVVLLWASRRWEPRRRTPASLRTPLRQIVYYTSLAALALSIIATVPILVVAISGDPMAWYVWATYPAYFVGAAATAFVIWLLQGVSHLATGRYLIGLLGGMCVYGAAAPVALALMHEHLHLRTMLLMAYILGALGGPCVALTLS